VAAAAAAEAEAQRKVDEKKEEEKARLAAIAKAKADTEAKVRICRCDRGVGSADAQTAHEKLVGARVLSLQLFLLLTFHVTALRSGEGRSRGAGGEAGCGGTGKGAALRRHLLYGSLFVCITVLFFLKYVRVLYSSPPLVTALRPPPTGGGRCQGARGGGGGGGEKRACEPFGPCARPLLD